MRYAFYPHSSYPLFFAWVFFFHSTLSTFNSIVERSVKTKCQRRSNSEFYKLPSKQVYWISLQTLRASFLANKEQNKCNASQVKFLQEMHLLSSWLPSFVPRKNALKYTYNTILHAHLFPDHNLTHSAQGCETIAAVPFRTRTNDGRTNYGRPFITWPHCFCHKQEDGNRNTFRLIWKKLHLNQIYYSVHSSTLILRTVLFLDKCVINVGLTHFSVKVALNALGLFFFQKGFV